MSGNKTFTHFCAALTLLILLLAAAQPALAKGPFTRLEVRGGGLEADWVLTDPALLEFFSFTYMPETRLVQAPADAEALLSQAYEITRFFKDESNGVFSAFDRLFFIPGEGDEPGLVYYAGIVNGSSEYDRKWYRADPAGEAAFEKALAFQTDPTGAWFDERRGMLTNVGALMGAFILLGWLRARWQKRGEQ